MLLGEDVDAASVAYRVGYEDASHFSREYKRLFGHPPLRDVESLRASVRRGGLLADRETAAVEGFLDPLGRYVSTWWPMRRCSKITAAKEKSVDSPNSRRASIVGSPMKPLFTVFAVGISLAALAQTPVPDAAEKVQPIAVGRKVPKVGVESLDGKSVSLPKLLSAQPTVLVFYRGGWCPFCNRQMDGLQSAQGELKKLGYRIVAISPDRAEELQKSVAKHQFTYQLLSDSTMDAARAFGVAFTVDGNTLTKYKGFGIDLERASGKPHHQLPVPSVFLVNKSGKIVYRYFNPDYKVRLSTEELLAAARQNR